MPKLTGLDEHRAWIFLNRGWRNAIRSSEKVINDDAPIKIFYDKHVAKLAAKRKAARRRALKSDSRN